MTNIEKLLAVQEIDLRIAGIEREMRDIPRRKDEELTRVDRHKTALETALDARKAKQAEIKKLEIEVDSSREKIVKFRTQQFDIKTNKEFKAIETEIKAVEEAIRAFEDNEIVLMEALETIKTDILQKQNDLAGEEKVVLADVAALDRRVAELDRDIQANREMREAAAREITDREWLDRYDAVRTKRLTGVAKLEGGICGGCHMQLPPSAVHNVHRHDTITTCDYCGRLLH